MREKNALKVMHPPYVSTDKISLSLHADTIDHFAVAMSLASSDLAIFVHWNQKHI